MNDLDNSWILLLLLMAFGFENNQNVNGMLSHMDNNQSVSFGQIFNNFDLNRKLEELQQNCEYIEWEQDMGAHIPFCKLDGELCNGQCRK